MKKNEIKFQTTILTWCIEIKTIDIPKIKFIVREWPNNAADAMPVKIVATVDEYFFKIVSASITKYGC